MCCAQLGCVLRLEDLHGLVEVFHGDTLLCAARGPAPPLNSDGHFKLALQLHDGITDVQCEDFCSSSLGELDVHAVFASGRVSVRYCVLHPATGMTCCLFDGPFRANGEDTYCDGYIRESDEVEMAPVVTLPEVTARASVSQGR